jgi:hypothetical protein
MPSDLGARGRYHIDRDRNVHTSKLMSAALLLMGLVFVFGAVVQYNDPDPVLWIIVYVAAAILSFVALRYAISMWLLAGVAGVSVVWAVTIAFGVDPDVYRSIFGELGMASLEVEEVREALGLVIIAVWMAVLAVVRPRRRP